MYTRGSTGLLIVLILAVLVILGGLLFSKGKEDGVEAESQPAAVAESSLPTSVGVTLSAVEGQTQTGKAKLRSFSGDTAVTVGVTDFVPNVPQPAQIHEGTCTNLGPALYTLNNLTQDVVKVPEGFSDTIIDININDLLLKLPLAIIVRKSLEEAHIIVACGNITDTEAPETKTTITTFEAGTATTTAPPIQNAP